MLQYSVRSVEQLLHIIITVYMLHLIEYDHETGRRIGPKNAHLSKLYLDKLFV